ncbi:MAG: CPBP family intramembrane glutamic endopeptidase [Acidobacteriaceae bacterium]
MSDPDFGPPTSPEATPSANPEPSSAWPGSAAPVEPALVTEPEPPGYLWHPREMPAPVEAVAAPPPPPRLIPNIGHAVVFFLLLIPTIIVGWIATFLALRVVFAHMPVRELIGLMTKNVSYMVGAQAVWYGLQWALAALIFTLWWHRPFLEGVHWNAGRARRWFTRLVLLGLLTGLAITLAGNFVPMPKAPPILEDLTKSTAGAWMLMVFGITVAPLTEELAFRGFLLPGFINVFRWMERRRMIGEGAVRSIGIPISIVLTTIPFALMHSAQVSNSWGPVLLIGMVSVILCIVRLVTESVACGVVVHACYNFTLFAGLLYQTDWFRHLDKLKT